MRSFALVRCVARLVVVETTDERMSKEKAYQFFRLVERMRASQKQYFKSRSQSALRESRALEQRVDDEIQRTNEILGTMPPKEQNLFTLNNETT